MTKFPSIFSFLLLSLHLEYLKVQKFYGGLAPWTPTRALPLNSAACSAPQTPALLANGLATLGQVISQAWIHWGAGLCAPLKRV